MLTDRQLAKMNVKDIIIEYLRAMGADGLCCVNPKLRSRKPPYPCRGCSTKWIIDDACTQGFQNGYCEPAKVHWFSENDQRCRECDESSDRGTECGCLSLRCYLPMEAT